MTDRDTILEALRAIADPEFSELFDCALGMKIGDGRALAIAKTHFETAALWLGRALPPVTPAESAPDA